MGAHVTTPPAEPAALPRIFGRYLLIHRLSRGGMGEIFLARYGMAGFEKLAVIKKVLPHLSADEEFIQRFVAEAQVAVKLQHANIAQVFEVGRVRDEYFLALEFIHGRDLRRSLALLGASGRGVPPDLALFIAREVANGLAYAHRRVDDEGRQLDLVHCDISPPNVMMSFDGEVKIIDFGIAKSALKAMTADSKRGFGKFGYMAPEQLIRGREVESATDIYALGSILFEMLTGERLYQLDETPDYKMLAKMVAKGQHPLPSDHDPALADYDELVRRALRPDPADRYNTAAEFRDEIQRKLVELNPTISSDELGAFMRFLFAEDVLRQQQEIERLDKTRLEDWEGELSRVAGETVSFALGHGIDPSSSSIDIAVDVADLLRPPPVLADREATDIDEAAGDRTDIVDLDVVAPEPRQRHQPNRKIAWLGLAAVVLLIGGAFAWLTTVGNDRSDGSKTAAFLAGATDAAVPTIEPIVTAVEVDDDAEPLDAAPPPAVRVKKREPKRVKTPKEPPAPGPEPEAEKGSKQRVDAKFSRAAREYRAFKKKYGPRLEKDWNDLASFVTFNKTGSNMAEVERRIDRFRSLVKRAAADL
jgi:serine/threonine protein kinase